MAAAIILAGGLGTRLRSTVADMPKPMAPVNGVPFLQLQLDYWIAQGVREFLISVGYKREAIIGHFGHAYGGASIAYAIEDEPLGTGGGLLLALERLQGDGPVLLMNGDTYFEVRASELLAFHASKGADLTFCLFRAGENGRYGGVQIDASGQVVNLNPGKAAIGDLANGGVYAINPGPFRKLRSRLPQKTSLEDDIMPALFREGARFFGLECAGRFIDIGVPSDYHSAASLLRGTSRC